jgi:hypothetical protein
MHGPKCAAREGCMGITLPLEPLEAKTGQPPQRQQLVASATALSLNFVQTMQYEYWSGKSTWRPLPLVTIIRPFFNAPYDLTNTIQDPRTHKLENVSWNVMIDRRHYAPAQHQ